MPSNETKTMILETMLIRLFPLISTRKSIISSKTRQEKKFCDSLEKSIKLSLIKQIV
jgi:hypothetical protein